MIRYTEQEKEIQEEEEVLFKMVFNVLHRNPTLEKHKDDLDFIKQKNLPQHIQIQDTVDSIYEQERTQTFSHLKHLKPVLERWVISNDEPKNIEAVIYQNLKLKEEFLAYKAKLKKREEEEKVKINELKSLK